MSLSLEIFGVLLGGGLGSVARLLLYRLANATFERTFPWGILGVNIIGCFAVGFFAAFLLGKYQIHPFWRSSLFIGFLGGFTTFSSFTLDTALMVQDSHYTLAAANILASLIFSLSATLIGLWIGKSLIS